MKAARQAREQIKIVPDLIKKEERLTRTRVSEKETLLRRDHRTETRLVGVEEKLTTRNKSEEGRENELSEISPLVGGDTHSKRARLVVHVLLKKSSDEKRREAHLNVVVAVATDSFKIGRVDVGASGDGMKEEEIGEEKEHEHLEGDEEVQRTDAAVALDAAHLERLYPILTLRPSSSHAKKGPLRATFFFALFPSGWIEGERRQIARLLGRSNQLIVPSPPSASPLITTLPSSSRQGRGGGGRGG